jgi:hypothetical protein
LTSLRRDAAWHIGKTIPSVNAGSVAEVARLGKVEIEEWDLKWLSSTELVARLVAGGVSRLTAERFIAIERGSAEPGRARPHPISRR